MKKNSGTRALGHPGTSSLRRIARSTSILASATCASRVLGFVRDLLLAQLFGTGLQAQAFVVAFRLPNLLRDLVAEGAVTSAFVPVLSWYRSKKEPEAFWGLAQTLLVRLTLAVGVLGLLGVWAAPGIVRVVAPGFVEDPEKFTLTVHLTRILFPLITLVGLWAFFTGLLNSLGHFALPALGPAVLNLAMIAACLWWVPHTEPGIQAVAIAVMIGGFIQLCLPIPEAIKRGFRPRWAWTHPGSSEVVRLFIPRLMGSAVYQANVLIHTALASLSGIVGVGAVAALYFANRLVQLPLALFGTASAQASLPALAEHAAQGDQEPFRDTLLAVLRMSAFVLIPSAVGLILLASPIVGVLFERGAFSESDTLMTAQALGWYAVGLLAYSVSKVLTGAFYAMRDTWTPVKLAAEAVALNVVLSLLLMWPMQLGGLALASSLANSLNALRLVRSLERRLDITLMVPLLRALFPILLASMLMGVGCYGLRPVAFAGYSKGLGLGIVIGSGILSYVFWCWVCRVKEMRHALRWLLRRHDSV